jgi:EAL domain-containing protein (putative c-di-GMP-specific phosphodiesterase class I)
MTTTPVPLPGRGAARTGGTPMAQPARRGESALAARLLAGGPPQIRYQPVVDLADPDCPVIGFEALARWPAAGSAITTDDVFAELNSGSDLGPELAELDLACRRAAVQGAFDGGLDRRSALFVNVEPLASLARPAAPDLEFWTRAVRDLTVVFEVTERKIVSDPAALLSAVHIARRAGCYVALDDVGANPDSLAMLEFVRPDMVKLDKSLIQGRLDADRARTMLAAAAYAERSGAAIIAEGIETEEQRGALMKLGCELGQGFLLGQPQPVNRWVGATV